MPEWKINRQNQFLIFDNRPNIDFRLSTSANCTRCPANTAVFGADGSLRRHCLCERGFSHPDPTPGEPCLPCPDGGVCDGQLTMPRAKPGFWGSDTSAVFLKCDNAISCAEGHLGRMCAECDDGWYSLEHRCRPCPDNAVWILVGVVAIALVLVVLFFRIVGKRIIAFAGVLRIVTKFFQVVALLSKMNLRWPSVVADTMRYTTSIFWLDPDVLASECSLRMFTFEVKWSRCPWFSPCSLPACTASSARRPRRPPSRSATGSSTRTCSCSHPLLSSCSA
jgi:hypothetical protein